MVKRIFNIREFSNYLNIRSVKEEEIHVVNFATEQEVLLKSDPITIDFYLLAIKPPIDKRLVTTHYMEDQSDASFMYIDGPHNSLDWDISPPTAGYTILVSAKYLNKLAKDYSFMHYNNHEALFLSKEEEVILWDIFKKTYDEFQKEFFSRDVMLSYISLIFSYTQIFYDRQFDTRSKIYHKVINDFYKNLEDFFSQTDVAGLPSVAFFAQKSNLSPNYFGDLVKHFTGKSPIDHIQDYVVQLAKDKLKNTSLSVSEISYSLGFDYPNYFARFFRKKTGIAPRVYRNQ